MLITIITICLNDQEGLKRTVESVQSQTISDYEYIIKDGGSCDGTIAYGKTLDGCKFISQTDKGIYDAMNQAIKEAHGRYICFMNSGDCFYSCESLREVTDIIEKTDVEAIYYGNCSINQKIYKTPVAISRRYLYKTFINHQSVFIPRKLFVKYGLYDTTYEIMGDHEFHVKLLKNKEKFIHMDMVVCNYKGQGLSSCPNNDNYKKEHRKIRQQYYSMIERVIYGVELALTLPNLRMYLSGDRAPKCIQMVYRRLVNFILYK